MGATCHLALPKTGSGLARLNKTLSQMGNQDNKQYGGRLLRAARLFAFFVSFSKII